MRAWRESHQRREGIDKEKRLRAPLRSRVHERVGLQVEGRGEVHVQLAVGADGEGGSRHEDILGVLKIENLVPIMRNSASRSISRKKHINTARTSGSAKTSGLQQKMQQHQQMQQRQILSPEMKQQMPHSLNSLIQSSMQRR